MTMTPADMAKALGVNTATVRRLRARAGLPRRKRGQGYTEEECVQLRAQLRYQPRARTKANREQLRASAHAQSDTLDDVSYLKGRVEALESRVKALEALLTNTLTAPWSVRTGVSDSPASVPAIPSLAKQRMRWDGRKLSLPIKPPKS